ncbi:glycosyltransferase family 39 protein [Candidatus Poribacteria bacterium]|nr:glycosyltransferase family 39 protein [Candidatus Poribacteria bacterium]
MNAQLQSESTWKRPAIWFGIALLLRLAYMAEQSATSFLFTIPLLDEKELSETARALLAGKGFGPEPLFKAPLYPLLLAGVMWLSGDGWFWAVRIFQHAAGAALAPMAFDTAGCLMKPGPGRPAAGAAAAAIVTFYGPLIRLEDLLLLDSLTVFLQSAMLWALVRWRTAAPGPAPIRWAALAGLMAALAWLNRPTIMPVLPFLALWMLGRRLLRPRFSSPGFKLRLAAAAALLAPPLLAMALLLGRNGVVSGEWLVLPWQGGYSFYHANRAGANGRYFVQPTQMNDQSGNTTRNLAIQLYLGAISLGQTSKPPEGHFYGSLDDYWFDRAKREIAADPVRWLGLMVRKAVYLLSDREIYNVEVYEVHRFSSWILRWQPFSFGLVWPLALASLGLLRGWPAGRRSMAGLMWLYAVLLGASIGLYYTSGRMRMPLVFPAIVLAAAALADPWTRRRAGGSPFRSARSAGVFTGLLVCGVALSWGDWWGVRSESLRFIEYTRLSVAAYDSGHAREALDYADMALAEKPGYPTIPMLRGQALYKLGRVDEAIDEYRLAIKTMPLTPSNAANLGVILYFEKHDPRGALANFAEALRRSPHLETAADMAALCALWLGNPAKAREYITPWLPADPERSSPILQIAAMALECAEGNEARARDLASKLIAKDGDVAVREIRRHADLIGFADCLGLPDAPPATASGSPAPP